MKSLIGRLFKKQKPFLEKLTTLFIGELSYEEFAKLESKKYPNQPKTSDEGFKSHHLYRCTDDCLRKR